MGSTKCGSGGETKPNAVYLVDTKFCIALSIVQSCYIVKGTDLWITRNIGHDRRAEGERGGGQSCPKSKNSVVVVHVWRAWKDSCSAAGKKRQWRHVQYLTPLSTPVIAINTRARPLFPRVLVIAYVRYFRMLYFVFQNESTLPIPYLTQLSHSPEPIGDNIKTTALVHTSILLLFFFRATRSTHKFAMKRCACVRTKENYWLCRYLTTPKIKARRWTPDLESALQNITPHASIRVVPACWPTLETFTYCPIDGVVRKNERIYFWFFFIEEHNYFHSRPAAKWTITEPLQSREHLHDQKKNQDWKKQIRPVE